VAEILVRTYEARDRDACTALWAQLTQWHRDLYDDQSIGGDDLSVWFDRYLVEQEPVHVWVAEREGRVVGFVGALARERRWELEPIVVDESERGRGVGRRLAQKLIEAAKTNGLRGVEVRPTARNVQALQFFHALGFDVLGQLELTLDLARPDRWREGERLADRDFRY
jgi:N-acetylglutamate synthase-like GNAT family acetyltransferase